ncbi:leucyl aminopeptidase [Amorphus orientalis]|uniref:Probable cytosol aminopeptidase n=1 Tax=Amorphus orientalis TaxID=649198 RepID=A0AAE4AU69_9HYPH|nr:leucyl aminopeptidase [Amorphus orientalis]MDQ0315629.1 leucyl aminopeptidase [Amorphus orientalis]
MTASPTISFVEASRPVDGVVIVLVGENAALGAIGREIDEASDGLLKRAMELASFKGKRLKTLELLAPAGLGYERIVLVGIGGGEPSESEWTDIGGAAFGALAARKSARKATLVAERPDGARVDTGAAMQMALGMRLRAYGFDRYKTKSEDNGSSEGIDIAFAVADPSEATEAWPNFSGIADGVILARDLVNEPANVLGPVEFAERASELSRLGVEIEVLEEADMKALGMNALLGVAQGSERPPRLVVMRWQGGNDAPPVAVVGKGVVFDTGGISIKPAANMEDMKGDMGGAATVVGLMHALAARKAHANVVGVIGLVENMPDGKAQRPGDIVTSMSGQTIEIINTDAEGRLVLADALHYTIDRFKPQFVVDLATLTGAVIIALGHHNAGLFTNDDKLATEFSAAGQATGDTVWRLPLGREYDKLIDSKVADMKNTGGRSAGSITAAQFLKRYVGETSWVHLDIAGTGMNAPTTEISRTFASGFGVRLIDRVIADNYEE